MSRVVIVGAAPGGATLAYLLATRGVDVVLLERQSDFAREFRGEVLMPSGLDAFRQMGLWDELTAVPHVTLRAVEMYLNGKLRARAACRIISIEWRLMCRPIWPSTFVVTAKTPFILFC